MELDEVRREEFRRDEIIASVLTARTPEQYEYAENLIVDWMQDHPRDFGMLDAGEQLAMMSGKYEPAAEDVSIPYRD